MTFFHSTKPKVLCVYTKKLMIFVRYNKIEVSQSLLAHMFPPPKPLINTHMTSDKMKPTSIEVQEQGREE